MTMFRQTRSETWFPNVNPWGVLTSPTAVQLAVHLTILLTSEPAAVGGSTVVLDFVEAAMQRQFNSSPGANITIGMRSVFFVYWSYIYIKRRAAMSQQKSKNAFLKLVAQTEPLLKEHILRENTNVLFKLNINFATVYSWETF